MLFFDNQSRSHSFPKSLRSREVLRAIEEIARRMQVPLAEREQSDVPSVWKSRLSEDVISTLRRLSNQRCAFCERKRDDLETYRFRPPAYAEPLKAIEGKDSYLWLTFNWWNFFPICVSCRPSRPDVFPVRGKRAPAPDPLRIDPLSANEIPDEAPQLYYPGELNHPSRAFEVGLDGMILAKTRRAQITIDHFNLNNADTSRAREHNLRAFAQGLIRGTLEISTTEIRSGEFGGARYLLLCRIAERLRSTLRRPKSLGVEDLHEFFEQLLKRSDSEQLLMAALNAIRDDDDHRALAFATAKTHTATPKVTEASRIASIKLSNYKSLEDIEFSLPDGLPEKTRYQLAPDFAGEVLKAPCLLFLGENATGKSSILEAVALACMNDRLRDELKLIARQLVLDPQYMGASERLPVSQSRIEVTFLSGRKLVLLINADDAAESFHELGDAEKPIVFAYGAHRLYGRTARRTPIRHVDTLFRDDRHLSNPENWLRRLARTNKIALDEVVSALRHIIQIDGHFENINVEAEQDGDPARCYIHIRKTRPDGTSYVLPHRLDIVSSGYRAILALVCDILEGLSKVTGGDVRAARHMRAIVLIDEIEAHLHPRWKLQVISGLRQALPHVTFLISSHDPLCIRGMFEGEVAALNRYQNRSESADAMPERVEPITDLENLEHLTIEQLLTSDLFQLFSTDDKVIDQTFAEVSDILAREDRGQPLSPQERQTLQLFNAEVANALPWGRGEVTRLVQEAVADYLAERRNDDAGRVQNARAKAKNEIKRLRWSGLFGQLFSQLRCNPAVAVVCCGDVGNALALSIIFTAPAQPAKISVGVR